MEYKEIKKYIVQKNYIGSGKEINAYKIDNKVIKLFHKDKKSNLEMISPQGLLKLTKLQLKCFNNPKELIYNNNDVMGYIEDYVEDNELNLEKLKESLDLLHEDIITLSKNGIIIGDIQYNYLSNKNEFKLNDMTSYKYINIEKLKNENNLKYMIEKIYRDNINTINVFLIGILEFGAYHKGKKYELTKTNQAVIYNLEKCKGIFYGDYLKNKSIKRK